MNLIEGIQRQNNRCREILQQCEDIGVPGVFLAAILRAAIQEGEDSIASGDCIRMIGAYKSLEGFKG